MKAKRIMRGDWVKVDGRPVKVTDAGPGQIGDRKVTEISYKRGSRSGMLRPGPDTDLTVWSGWGNT